MCDTHLVYQNSNSNVDLYFSEVSYADPDEDPETDQGDFDCEEGVIASFEDANEEKELLKGDAITIGTKDKKGATVYRPGWLLLDPEEIHAATTRKKAVYRYAVIFSVEGGSNLQSTFFPPKPAKGKKETKLRASQIANMPEVKKRNAEDLYSAQRKAVKFRFST